MPWGINPDAKQDIGINPHVANNLSRDWSLTRIRGLRVYVLFSCCYPKFTHKNLVTALSPKIVWFGHWTADFWHCRACPLSDKSFILKECVFWCLPCSFKFALSGLTTHTFHTLENVIRLFGMEEVSREMMPKLSAQLKEDILHQSMILRLMSFCLVFSK